MPLPRFLFSAALALAGCSLGAQGTVVLQLENYAAVPQSGTLANSNNNALYVARVNFLREEPGGGLDRLFVNDLNGKLYILNKTTRQFAMYLDFQRNPAEAPDATGLFPAFTRAAGYANGLVTFQFDPEYHRAGSPNFGKFYTVHIEVDTNDGDARRLPNASGHPGFANAAAYAPSPVQEAPGNDNPNTRQAVLIEWQDTNPADTLFQGTARELLRVEFNGRIHPMGDLLFNPLATTAAHPDWRKLYIAIGDGGAGEQNNAVLHPTPQRLDVLQGKILRISPDDPDQDGPLRYGIPADNPFVGSAPAASVRQEIYAYGFRNPHRITWDATTNVMLAADIGFHSWEEINLVRRGGNYGWGVREGTFAFDVARERADRPPTVSANDSANYLDPVLQYPHSPALGYGDAIAGGFVYRGARVPELVGKFVFGDITTGELFYTDASALIAADDGNRDTLAPLNRVQLAWDNPRDAAPAQRFDRMYEIVADEYRARGGPLNRLPGSATVSDLTGGGRADIRLAVDAAGELYVLSKSDGMIRAITGAVRATRAPVIQRHPAARVLNAGGTLVLSIEASADTAAYQWKHDGRVIPGAHGPTLVRWRVTAADSGSYTVDVTNAAGTTTSNSARVTVAPLAAPGRITNFSIRSRAGSGAQTLIVGFAGRASEDQPLLVRGVGPGLTAFGVTGALSDPKLEVYGVERGTGRATKLAENDDWDLGSASLAALTSRVNAFPLAPRSRDAALVLTSLPPDSYTVQISGTSATGVALAELFDGSPAGSSGPGLSNVSARTEVGAGDDVLIAGFVIGGDSARTVLVRAAGPILRTFGVTGTLADPKLTLFSGSVPIAESDNWQTSPELVETFSEVGAFPFVARSRDTVLLLTLPPGLYTAQVSGIGSSATGVALVEVYLLP